MSLRRRVLVGFIAVGAVLVLTNVVIYGTFRAYLLNRVDAQLVDVATRPILRADRARLVQNTTVSEYFIAFGGPSVPLARISPALADDSHAPRIDPLELANRATDPADPPAPFTVPAQSGAGSWRLVAMTAPTEGRFVVVGVSLDGVMATLGRITLVQVLGTAAVLVALGLVSSWMLRLGVHPLEDMARTADAIAGGDLSHRVDHPSEGTEAGRLGVALNSMLGRIEESFRAREASEERVRRFAADASHELRTPLTSIHGYAELWRAGGLRSEADLAEAMRRMEQEARRMGALIEDLLLLARLDQRRPLERTSVALDGLAADAVRDALAVEPGRPITMEVVPVTVEGDEMRLRQVVANLLANARVHTPPGAPVRVTVSVDGPVARLEVADEGPGMEPEVAARVFERFYRADPSRARSAGGTGLGLAIASAVVDAHAGTITLDSEPGRGSRFTVELPGRARVDGAAPAATELPGSRTAGPRQATVSGPRTVGSA
ncbi:MAG: sensor histidine kinase [Acidimicrobiales bacterium]